MVVTPFKENGEIDFNALTEHADWMIKEGVHGLIPNGSTGEYAAMTWDEQKEEIRCVVDAAKGRVPVVAGVTAETANRVIELSNVATRYGADGIMLLTTPYNYPTQDEVYNHFKMISESVDMLIMVYNNPLVHRCGYLIRSDSAAAGA